MPEEIIITPPVGKLLEVRTPPADLPSDMVSALSEPSTIERSLDTYNRDVSEMNPVEQYIAAFDPKSDVWSINSQASENIPGPIVYEEEGVAWGQYIVIGIVILIITKGRLLKWVG